MRFVRVMGGVGDGLESISQRMIVSRRAGTLSINIEGIISHRQSDNAIVNQASRLKRRLDSFLHPPAHLTGSGCRF